MQPKEEDQEPSLLTLTPRQLLERLAVLQAGYRITLNLTHLQVEDVLELIYDCDGMISRLEIFNLKDWATAQTAHIEAISRLQEAINEQNPIALKRIILEIIASVETAADGNPEKRAQIEKLTYILNNSRARAIICPGSVTAPAKKSTIIPSTQVALFSFIMFPSSFS